MNLSLSLMSTDLTDYPQAISQSHLFEFCATVTNQREENDEYNDVDVGFVGVDVRCE